MNKQEALKKLEKIEIENSFGHWVGYYGAKELIEQIGPEKPVVPRFVAEWIEKSKTVAAGTLKGAYINAPEKVRLWWNGDNVANVQLFARAWLDGYEVEKEPIYVIRSKGTTNKDGAQQRLCHSSEKGNYFWCGKFSKFKHKFTRKELEQVGFGWVFDCEGVEVREVE